MRLPRTSSELRAIVNDADVASPVESGLRLVEIADAPADANGSNGHPPSLMDELLAELRAQRRRTARLAVKTGGRVLFLRAEEIDWVEAAGNYVKLHVGAESHLYRESMKNMEVRLDGETFVRIHRSSIVNVDRIRELQPWFHGEYVVILQDGTRLMASRVFSDRLDRLIA